MSVAEEISKRPFRWDLSQRVAAKTNFVRLSDLNTGKTIFKNLREEEEKIYRESFTGTKYLKDEERRLVK